MTQPAQTHHTTTHLSSNGIATLTRGNAEAFTTRLKVLMPLLGGLAAASRDFH